MKYKLGIFILLFLAVASMSAPQTPSTNQANPANPAIPCNDPVSADTKKEVVEHDPLADPAEELRIRAQKKMDEKNFKELQEAATELATVSGRMSKEIDESGQFVLSLRVLDDLDQIEKLTKKVRSRAR
jgi:hypothetical protein